MFAEFMHHSQIVLKQHPHYGGTLTFVIALLESLAIIGSIVPGSVTMTAIGALIGNATLPLFSTLLCAISGALVGDTLSYWFGLKYAPYIYQLSWIKKRHHWLDKGQAFTKRYGTASLVIGRFFGPMRSMMPMVVGLFRMKPLPFIAGIIPSAVLWSMLYLTPGIFFGLLAHDFPHPISHHFILKGLAYLLTFVLLMAIIQRIRPKLSKQLHMIVDGIYQTCFGVNQPQPRYVYPCLISLVRATLLGMAFAWLGYHVHHQTGISSLNQPSYYFLQSLHQPFWNAIHLATTFMADKYSFILPILAITSFLYLQKAWRLGTLWLTMHALFYAVIKIVKMSYMVARPPPLFFTSWDIPAFQVVMSV